jgi:hypothetical protein
LSSSLLVAITPKPSMLLSSAMTCRDDRWWTRHIERRCSDGDSDGAALAVRLCCKSALHSTSTGVRPCWLRIDGSPPRPSRNSVASTSRLPHALCSGVQPSLSATLTSAPYAHSSASTGTEQARCAAVLPSRLRVAGDDPAASSTAAHSA